MEHITDCKITQVHKGPSGESEWGPWQVYNLYLDKSELKFSWMGGPKKWVPKEGAQVKHIGYEVEVKGEYTNYRIKELDLPESNKPPEPKPKANGNNHEASFYVSYMKDIAVAILNNGDNLETANLDLIAKRIGKAGLIMMQEGMNGGEIPPEKPKKAPRIDEREKKDILPEEDDMMIPCDMLQKEVHARENCSKLCDDKARLRCKEFAKWRKKNPDVKL